MSAEALTCANHPQRETVLRCNRCGKPICTSCAVQTPVGYRCRDCVRQQQQVYETAGQGALVVGALVAAVGAGVATALLDSLGFWFWSFLLAPVAGGGIAEVVRWSVRRKRSRRLPLSAALGAGLGIGIYLLSRALPWLFLLANRVPGAFSGAAGLLFPLGYGALMVSTLYARLRGSRM